jgi:hypothetical protein
MSDNFRIRSISGEFRKAWAQRDDTTPQPKKRLVEECEIIWVYALQKVFGKKALLAAIREARPFRVPVLGGCFDVWLTDEIHRLPGRQERWSEDGTCRLWLVCTGCRQKVGKLYYYSTDGLRSALLCRTCHRLTYLSVNSGGSRWYREVARPVKRLLAEKERLSGQRGGRHRDRLLEIEAQVRGLKERLKPKTKPVRLPLGRLGTSQKRPYRAIHLLE